LLPEHPPVYSLLVVPLVGTRGCYGWIYLTNRSEGMPFTDTDEELLGLLARQAAMAYENDLLAVRASRDGLTGLLNRFEFDAAIQRECERAQRQGSPLALVMVDVDHFKRCNDRYGHPAGDSVLRMIAAELKKSVRAYDLVFRYGGDEFALLLPGATMADAWLRAEQCRTSVRELDARCDGQVIGSITVSIGVAAYPEQGEDTLLCIADMALYEAKHQGRDRSCLASRGGDS
jgi:diguanylate cyclase (GGDEF)-like protein